MILKIHRLQKNLVHYLDVLLVNDVYFCHCLEDRTCQEMTNRPNYIPAGVYSCRLSFSNHFQEITPIIDHVPGFSNVRIFLLTKDTLRAGSFQVGLLDQNDILRFSRLKFDQLVAMLDVVNVPVEITIQDMLYEKM